MIYADVTLEQLNISSHPLPLEMDGWRQYIDMITTQPQLSSQLLCRCCPGLGGSAPAARRGSAASGLPLHRGCECQRGHMGQLGTLHNVKAVSQHWPLLWWQVWPRDMLHMVTRQDTWVTKTKPHLTPAHHSWDDAWLIHPSPVACAYQLECKLRLPSNTQWPPSVYKIFCNIMLMLRQRKSQEVTSI